MPTEQQITDVKDSFLWEPFVKFCIDHGIGDPNRADHAIEDWWPEWECFEAGADAFRHWDRHANNDD